MDTVYDNLSSLILFTILFLVVYTALLNIYFIYKNGFYVTVNCWFCNTNSKVPYRNRNCFECPQCTQYNGFEKNGDYNKIIESQHSESLNNILAKDKTGFTSIKPSNGLCESCNKNQQLRVSQLANYEPLDNKNFEKEIEHFEKQLEKSYKLCKICSNIVQNTIRKQNAWLFGNRLKNLKSPNKKCLKKKQSQSYKAGIRFDQNLSVVNCILIILSAFNLIILCGLESFIPIRLLPYNSLPSNVIFSDVYTKIYNISIATVGNLKYMKYFPKTVTIPETKVLPISMIGLFIELLSMIGSNSYTTFGKLGKLLSWVLLGLTSAAQFKSDICIYTFTLQLFCSMWLMCNSPIGSAQKHPKKYALKRIKKTYEIAGYSENDESSSESLDDSIATYRTASVKLSPITASNNNSVNRSFETVKSKISPLLNSTFTHNATPTARNIELNKHFDELNLGVFEGNRSFSNQSFKRTTSPNPFYSTKAQSPGSQFGYGMLNDSRSIFTSRVPHNQLFKSNNTSFNTTFHSVNNAAITENHKSVFSNPSGKLSPTSDGFERMSVQMEPFNLSNNSTFGVLEERMPSFLSLNMNSPNKKPSFINLNMNSPTRNVASDNNRINSQYSGMNKTEPVYSLKSQNIQNVTFHQNSHQATLNHSFRPLSPEASMKRSNRTYLSPSRLNNIRTFHSDAKENDNLSLSFHMSNTPTSGLFTNLNNSQSSPRFVVNSMANMQCRSPFVSGIAGKNNNSRASSSSSGFVSNGDFGKVRTRSLPGSREHSPDRNSLLSEPAYHFKID